MVQTFEKAPFKADHVGSLLRPESLLKARNDYLRMGNITTNNFVKLRLKKLKKLLINKLR